VILTKFLPLQSETVRAQQSIEQAQLAELQRMAEDAERPLTALEKTRLVHLQSMDDKQRKEVGCHRYHQDIISSPTPQRTFLPPTPIMPPHHYLELHHLHTSATPFSLLTRSSSQAPPPEVLDKTFGQLLDQTASSSNYQGLLVEDELEGLTTPFVQELMTKVRIP
jgi:hypothetical protein